MKKILNKINLAIAIALVSITASVAQTVTVPPNCDVKVTNTALGGVSGLGGKVTAGGMVTMVDGVTPNGIFTFTPQSGITLNATKGVNWFLNGDLSTTVTTPNFNSAVQTQTNSFTSTILSYNKFARPTELIAPSLGTFARSKGRVTVTYTVDGPFQCDQTLKFDIFKTLPSNAILPQIVGPCSAIAGEQVTYSVDQVASDNTNDEIGFDKYYWTGIPAGATNIYNSADNSSITFTLPNATQFTLNCCIGRANPWDGGLTATRASIANANSCVSKVVNSPLPTAPFWGMSPRCAPSVAGTFSVAYFQNSSYAVSNNIYTWSTEPGSGWTVGAQTPTNVTINVTAGNNPSYLKLKITNPNGCASVDFQYPISRWGATSVAPTGMVLPTCFSVDVPGTVSVIISNPQITGFYTAETFNTGGGSLGISDCILNGNTLTFPTAALLSGSTYNFKITHFANTCVEIPLATTTNNVTVVGNGATLARTVGASQDTYTVTTPVGMVNPQFEWSTCTAAGICTPIQNNSAVLILNNPVAPASGNTVCVNVYPSGSTCKTRLITAQGSRTRTLSANAGQVLVKPDSPTIYPNPNTGNFIIKIGGFKKSASGYLVDMSGKKIKDFSLVKGENKIDNKSLSSGSYLVVLTIDGLKETKKVIIK